MVARGDLAVEVGNAAVPALQKRMIRMAREMNKLVITATQMMESMIVNPVPTRAECQRRRQRGARRHRRGDAVGRDRGRPLPGRDGRDRWRAICVEAEQSEDDHARRRLPQQDVHAASTSRSRWRALFTALPPRLQGDRSR